MQSKLMLVIWLTLLLHMLFGVGKADISTAVQGNLTPAPSSGPGLGCHRRLYTYRIRQIDDNGNYWMVQWREVGGWEGGAL